MKGNNELVFNEATMIEALQEYLDKRMPTESVEVTSVKPSADYSFTVAIKEKE